MVVLPVKFHKFLRNHENDPTNALLPYMMMARVKRKEIHACENRLRRKQNLVSNQNYFFFLKTDIDNKDEGSNASNHSSKPPLQTFCAIEKRQRDHHKRLAVQMAKKSRDSELTRVNKALAKLPSGN